MYVTSLLSDVSYLFYSFLFCNADKKLALLGQGSFGQVFLVQNKITGKQYAMKQTYFEQRLRNDQKAEYLILTQYTPVFTSPFIVRLYDTLFDAHYLRLFIDYCGGGSLRDRINYRKNFAKHPFSENVFYCSLDGFHIVISTITFVLASNDDSCATSSWTSRSA